MEEPPHLTPVASHLPELRNDDELYRNRQGENGWVTAFPGMQVWLDTRQSGAFQRWLHEQGLTLELSNEAPSTWLVRPAGELDNDEFSKHMLRRGELRRHRRYFNESPEDSANAAEQ